MEEHSFDLIVIGAGPGGYVSAIRAAQLGLKVACIEKESALGGTCLRVGCIPSKALLEASHQYHNAKDKLSSFGVMTEKVSLDLEVMMQHKDTTVSALTKGVAGLLKKNKVSHYCGLGTIKAAGQVVVTDASGAETALKGDRILIATGSRSAPLRGVEIDGTRVGTSTEALAYPEVPEHLVVIGAGVIGLELGSVWSRLGAKVTVLEYLNRILPGMDAEIAQEALRMFKKQGLNFKLGSKVTGARATDDGAIVECEGQEPITADRVLLSVGRLPNTEGLGLENVNIETDQRGRIPVNAHFETSTAGVYAIGDVIAGPMLAHKAEEELKKDEVPYRKGSFPLAANGRARAVGRTEGRVKVLAHAETDRILGVHIVSAHAGDLIAECGVAMEFGASSEDLARACHAHPCMAEAVKEAALAVDSRALHI